jgi:hypothetical protein
MAKKVRATITSIKESSAISNVEYDEMTETLLVTFVSGRMYCYSTITPSTFERLRNAKSIGRFFTKEIKSIYADCCTRVR